MKRDPRIIQAIREMGDALSVHQVTGPAFQVTRKDIAETMRSCGVDEDEAIERLADYVVRRLEGVE